MQPDADPSAFSRIAVSTQYVIEVDALEDLPAHFTEARHLAEARSVGKLRFKFGSPVEFQVAQEIRNDPNHPMRDVVPAQHRPDDPVVQGIARAAKTAGRLPADVDLDRDPWVIMTDISHGFDPGSVKFADCKLGPMVQSAAMARGEGQSPTEAASRKFKGDLIDVTTAATWRGYRAKEGTDVREGRFKRWTSAYSSEDILRGLTSSQQVQASLARDIEKARTALNTLGETFPGSSVLIITGTRNGQAAGVAKLIDFEHRVKADDGAAKTDLGLKNIQAVFENLASAPSVAALARTSVALAAAGSPRVTRAHVGQANPRAISQAAALSSGGPMARTPQAVTPAVKPVTEQTHAKKRHR